MSTVDIGVFRLVDPPLDMEQVVRDTIAAIDYPWERLHQSVVEDDWDRACFIRWIEHNNGSASGSYWGTNDIELSTQFTGWENSVPFILAHEIGHLVDHATFDKRTRDDLTALFHQGPGMPVEMLHHSNDSPNYRHPIEGWDDSVDNDYVARLNECFADEFVATFAPSIWEGHFPRFVHWTDDLDAVRRITLQRDMDLAPVQAAERKSVDMRRDPLIEHALADLATWRKRHPSSKVARAKVLVARRALKAIRPK